MFKRFFNWWSGCTPDLYPFHPALKEIVPFSSTPALVLSLARNVSEHLKTTPTETAIVFFLADGAKSTAGDVIDYLPKISGAHVHRLLKQMVEDKLLCKHVCEHGLASYRLSEDTELVLQNLL